VAHDAYAARPEAEASESSRFEANGPRWIWTSSAWPRDAEFGSLSPKPGSTLLLVTKHRCDTKCKDSQNLIDRFARMGLTIIPRGAHDATIRGRVWPGRDRFVTDELPALRAHWQEVVAILKAPPTGTNG
jgi:hypothetical protein